jgi:hypothetical protein
MIQKGLKVGAEIPYDEVSLPLSLYMFIAFLCRHDVHLGGLCPSGLFRRRWFVLSDVPLDADDDGCFYIESITVGGQ